MEKYISKSAIMAEIDFILNETNYKPFTDEVLGERKVCRDIKDFLNTLVTKEVDLDKEIEVYFNNWVDDVPEDTNPNGIEMPNGKYAHLSDLNQIARHFFELGLRVQKGELTMTQEDYDGF